MDDLSDLLQHESASAVLDGSLIPQEDLGILKRALRAPGAHLTLLGGDPSFGPLRQLLKHPRTRWMPYPPDSEELAALCSPDQQAAPPATTTPASSVATSAFIAPISPPSTPIATESTLPEQEPFSTPSPPVTPPNPPAAPTPIDANPTLAHIESVLSQPVAALHLTGLQPAPALSPAADAAQAPEVDQEPQPDPAPIPQTPADPPPPATLRPRATAQPTAPPAAHNEPPWFKDQVADLADLVQTIYTSASALETEDEAAAPPGLYSDALRLVQFTRTLGYLAAPPPRGQTELDLSALAEDLLRGAGQAPDAPRFLMRTDEPLTVRANKELLVQALDAILVLARLCAGPEGEVRLTGTHTDTAIALHLTFPTGPLQGLTAEQIATPYALRARLPDMGKNALRAAACIVEGQGGSLILTAATPDHLHYTLTLPPARPKGAATAPEPEQ